MTDKGLEGVREALEQIARQVRDAAYPHDEQEWGGADVVIQSRRADWGPAIRGAEPPSAGYGEAQFYPEPRCVITRYARELSWLFHQLKDAFFRVIDGCTKVEFYGRLANAANLYKERLAGQSEDERDLLLSVLHEGFAIRDEMAAGEFRYLVLADGNRTWHDILIESESEGYLGIEATRRFFNELAADWEGDAHDA